MNTCDGCYECCELFEVKSSKTKTIEIINIDKPAGILCEHCNSGCTVYETRPKICRDFVCAYIQQEGISIELRPDKCGIIFEKLNDSLFLGTVRPKKQVSHFAIRQIEEFNRQGFTVILKKHDTLDPMIKLAQGHNYTTVWNEYIELRKLANGEYSNN